MSRFKIDHPINAALHAIAGHDHMLGYFVELHRSGRHPPIKTIDVFTLGQPVSLHDCFEFLIKQGLIDRADLEAALMAMQDGTRVRSRKVQRVVEVIAAFKSAADQLRISSR